MTDQPTKKTTYKILLVEDEPDLRNLYATLLKSQGYDVKEAENGNSALAQMKEGGFDLVLLDIMLPGIDGLHILKELKDNPPANSNKAVVLLTNLNQDQVVAQALEYNVRGYIVKSSYTPDKFLLEVKGILTSEE
jgi:CheY-like chemotaxis protein